MILSFGSAPIDPTATLFVIGLMFASAKLGGEIAARLGTAALLGEVLAGALIGPHALGLIREDEVTTALAELGVVVLLFAVGIETDFNELRDVGPRGIAVGSAGIVLPFLLGAALMLLIGQGTVQALFVGAAMVATSVGITARVLSDLGLMNRRESLIVIAAAVADDVLGLLVLAVITSFGSGIDILRLGVLLIESLAFIAIAITIGRVGVRRFGPRVEHLRIPHGALSFAFIVLMAFAILAGFIGLAAIVGAYLAGLLIAELSPEFELKRDVDTLQAILAPFFFVMVGARLDLRGLADPTTLAIGSAITLIAIVTKLVGCGLAMYGTTLRSAVMVGVGMVPRGEVGLVVATLGLTAGVINASLYAAILMMVAVTTLVAPLLIGPVFADRPRPAPAR